MTEREEQKAREIATLPEEWYRRAMDGRAAKKLSMKAARQLIDCANELKPLLAQALTACALAEAKWWLEKAGRDGHFWIVSPLSKHPDNCRCEAHERIAGLERAAGGKVLGAT